MTLKTYLYILFFMVFLTGFLAGIVMMKTDSWLPLFIASLVTVLAKRRVVQIVSVITKPKCDVSLKECQSFYDTDTCAVHAKPPFAPPADTKWGKISK